MITFKAIKCWKYADMAFKSYGLKLWLIVHNQLMRKDWIGCSLVQRERFHMGAVRIYPVGVVSRCNTSGFSPPNCCLHQEWTPWDEPQKMRTGRFWQRKTNSYLRSIHCNFVCHCAGCMQKHDGWLKEFPRSLFSQAFWNSMFQTQSIWQMNSTCYGFFLYKPPK